MRELFWLVILMIGGFAMMREKLDNKKYPDTSQARQASQNKLFSEIKKIDKRYGKHSEQAQIARQRVQDGKLTPSLRRKHFQRLNSSPEV